MVKTPYSAEPISLHKLYYPLQEVNEKTVLIQQIYLLENSTSGSKRIILENLTAKQFVTDLICYLNGKTFNPYAESKLSMPELFALYKYRNIGFHVLIYQEQNTILVGLQIGSISYIENSWDISFNIASIEIPSSRNSICNIL